jgi:Holliday junction resolvase
MVRLYRSGVGLGFLGDRREWVFQVVLSWLTSRVKEQDIQRDILDYLEARGYDIWKYPSQGMLVGKGGGKRVKQKMKGIPDIIGWTNEGYFLAIEVKRPGYDPSDDQQKFIDKVNKKGGLAFVASSVDDVIERGL